MTNSPAEMVRLTVPASLRYRDVAMRTAAAVCRIVALAPDMADGWTHEVMSAFGEAFNNVCLHGHGGEPGHHVEIEIEARRDRLTIRVLDHGASYDPLSAPMPDLDALPEGGLGVYIMKSFMDELTYQAGRPNVLEMVKIVRRRPGSEPSAT